MKKVKYGLLTIVFPLIVVSCSSEEVAEKKQAKMDPTEEGFNLQGAIELFKQAKDPEDFERSLNVKDNPVNNLDLNDDGKIDFIKVIDRSKDQSHSIVMQVVLNEKENQDIAAIMIQKNGPSSARLQIIGNEVLYGKEVVLEPIAKDEDGGSKPTAMLLASNTTITVNVWTWPIIQHVYRVEYVPYVSPVRWEVYPVWYEPVHHHHKHHGKGHAYGHYKHDYDDVYYRAVPVCELESAHGLYIEHRTNSATISIEFGREFPNFRVEEDEHHHDKHHDKHHEQDFGEHHDNGNGHHEKEWNQGQGEKHDKEDKHDIKFNLKENHQPSHEKGNDHGNGGNGGGKPEHGNGGGKQDHAGNGGGHGKGKK